MNKIVKILVAIFVALLTILTLWWGGNITKISVTGDFRFEQTLQTTAEKCLGQFIGNSYWTLQENVVKKAVLKCDPTIISATSSNSFPGGLTVNIKVIDAIVKIENGDNTCILYQDSATKVVLGADRCVFYVLPNLVGKEVSSNSFVIDYAVALISQLKTNNIIATKIELKGESIAPWYHVVLDDKTNVYLPSGANLKDKVLVLAAARNGLNTAKERYSTIDLRFDMVTYR